ncbi:immunoglobulin superfamily member 1-like isoform X2 [Chiloscyllium plagiosum]|uniref:immunoglobulin superfamily member 1-like isoform X1 n=2 Tax=Chiloscyllium plagiosum TaxID=36176 RepID=UPI001CB88A34|nr:immunoglobulin superfamily member 1-like isoform X1 [Chiloscyllium plagiosum]XP_043539650.1 immunoglobulin superfamily member 1-like isoform X2 [Chiloscyllium plagiosum]
MDLISQDSLARLSWLLELASLDAQGFALPQPTMTVDPPLKIILPGEEFLLICHFPLTRCNVEFYRNYTHRISSIFDVSHAATLKNREDRTSIGHNSYMCKYQKFFDNNKTWEYSRLSEPTELIITGVIPKPTISLEPASGAVTVGGEVQINCTSSYPSHIARLYKNNSRIPILTKNVSDSEQTVIFTIEDLETLDSGEYSCSFAKTLKGTEYTSSRSDTVKLNVTYDISKPTIHMEPAFGTISVGGRVQITCNSSSPSIASHLYKKYVNKPFDVHNNSGSEWSVTFIMQDLVPAESGKFCCSFMKMANGEVYETLRSNFVNIVVTAELPKPTISVLPASGVVTVGDSVQINCSSNYPCQTSQLNKKYGKIPVATRQVSDSEVSVTYKMRDLEPKESGLYACHCLAIVKGAVYKSPLSDFMEINITDILPTAMISVHPPSGVVNRGNTFRLTCSGSILSSGGWYYLYQVGEQTLSKSVAGFVQSTAFNILTRAGTWKYKCQYARKVNKTKHYSPTSEPVLVTVRDRNGASHVYFSPLYLFGFVLLGSLIILLTE